MTKTVIAICGPTASGKTGVAIALARALREGGSDPIAISCDSMQVYRGLPILTNQPSDEEQAALEHRLVGFVDPTEEFSAGRFAELAHAEIDRALAGGRVPIVVGGTGLYMRAALCELELRPVVPDAVREEVEREIAAGGLAVLHAALPERLRERAHPNDRKRIARMSELLRAGIEPSESSAGLWTRQTRHPTRIFGLAMDRGALAERIDRRTEAMLGAGVEAEVRAVEASGAGRTVGLAHGYREVSEGRIEDWKRAQRTYARRQMTWMRKTPGLELVERDGRSDEEVALEIAERLGPR